MLAKNQLAKTHPSLLLLVVLLVVGLVLDLLVGLLVVEVGTCSPIDNTKKYSMLNKRYNSPSCLVK